MYLGSLRLFVLFVCMCMHVCMYACIGGVGVMGGKHGILRQHYLLLCLCLLMLETLCVHVSESTSVGSFVYVHVSASFCVLYINAY